MFNAIKVMVSIKRDVMDVATKPVFKHEVEILEEIFGESAVNIIDTPEHDLSNHILERRIYKGEKPQKGQAPESYSALWPLDEGDEYARLSQVYGLHATVKQPNVDYIFGSLKRSRLAKEYHVDEADLEQDDAPPQPTKKQKLQAQLEEKGIEYEGSTVKEMEQMLADLEDDDGEDTPDQELDI